MTDDQVAHQRELDRGQRFRFGANWARFLSSVDQRRIEAAVASLREMLKAHDLAGKTFLDVGCGSGLFSLAASRLGAEVTSFDFDPRSVACTEELKRRYGGGPTQWRIGRGSVLDRGYLAPLGQFDVVYAWGVLHHTGARWDAMDNVAGLVKPDGFLYLAIYNDQGWRSKYWRVVKRLYNQNRLLRGLVLVLHVWYLYFLRAVVRLVRGKGRPPRGMSLWHDTIDWLGGYPFEVARPEEVVAFYRQRGFQAVDIRTCGHKSGCNEFVLRRGERG
jgi:2-polyprenyl-6-hydroxyphenyl methylase/3-demethylubiquinone-9 3-methyltransferase